MQTKILLIGLLLVLLTACGGTNEKAKSDVSTSESEAIKGMEAAFSGNYDAASKYICEPDLEDIGQQPDLSPGIQYLPFRYKTYEYEGEEYPIYIVEINGEVKRLVLLVKRRQTSTFIDPEHSDSGTIEWEGRWRTLEPIWQIDPQATSDIQAMGFTRGIDCARSGEQMICEIKLAGADNEPNFEQLYPTLNYTLIVTWDVIGGNLAGGGKLCNASARVLNPS
ncbi:MAG TPA: hypothetical protein VHP83_12635 [Aggregatilineaceae bacterium]|nr:hypothetical protein [Aggregatilineaceae bacterium]